MNEKNAVFRVNARLANRRTFVSGVHFEFFVPNFGQNFEKKSENAHPSKKRTVFSEKLEVSDSNRRYRSQLLPNGLLFAYPLLYLRYFRWRLRLQQQPVPFPNKQEYHQLLLFLKDILFNIVPFPFCKSRSIDLFLLKTGDFERKSPICCLI